MTELCEPMALGVFGEKPVECPLNHDDLEPIKSENDFKGDGGVLGTNMEAGTSTIIYQPNQRASPNPDPYPTGRSNKDEPIEIDGHSYPVTCAAHHLIPAQASLKQATKLHSWMVYKNNDQPVGGKGGSPAKGKVWADVGYDVNGAENGVWLPGNYAVGGGNGTGEWTREPSAYSDNEDCSTPPPQKPSKKRVNSDLTGRLHDFEEDNRKGKYVLQATWLFRAQFHDSHGDYSDQVTAILQKLGTLYEEHPTVWQSDCQKCTERFKKIKNEGAPTHFALAHRLNGVSKRLRNFLVGSRGHPTFYTSQWGKKAADDGLDRLEGEIPC